MKYLVGFVFWISAVTVVSAQEALHLSYKEAVSIAMDNNVGLKQEQNFLRGIQANKTASLGSLAPDIRLSGQGWRNDGNFFIEQEARVVNTISENVFGSINANILIFNGLSQQNTIKREGHNSEAQLLTIDRTRQSVINDLTRQYLLVLQDQEQVKIAYQNLENQQILFDQIEAMFEAGSRAITDKYDQDYQLKSAELDIIRAENMLRNDKAILAQIMLIDPTVELTLEDPGWDVNDINISDYNPEDIYDIALKSRGDFKSMQEAEAASKRNVAVTKGVYIPTLSGFYSWSSRYTDQTISRDFSEQFLVDNQRQQYGIQLNIPIYNGLRGRASVINAKVQHENAKLNVENHEMLVKTEVLRAFQNFQDVGQAYEVSLVQFQAAEKSFETQRESYDLGISGLIEVSQANVRYVEAQTSLSRAKYALLFQTILMDYAIGTLKIDQIPD